MSKHDQTITIEGNECHILFMDDHRGINELENLIYDRGVMLALDTETTGLRPGNDRIRLVQFGTDTKAWLLPFSEWRNEIRTWLWNRRCTIITQNGLFDWLQFAVEYGEMPPLHNIEDTMILAHHYDGRAPKDGGLGRSLESLIAQWIDKDLAHEVKGSMARLADAENATRRADYEAQLAQLKAEWKAANDSRARADRVKWADVVKPERPKRVTKGDIFREIELTNPTYLRYAAVDVLTLGRIYTKLRKRLEGTGIHDLSLYDQDMEDVRCTLRMMFREGKGIGVDVPYFEALGRQLDAERAEHEARLRDKGIDKPSSTKQVTAALQAEGHVLTETTNAGNLKVDERILKQCEDRGSEVAASIMAAKRAAKWRSTFVDGILEFTWNGRIFPQFNPLGAATGRFSSRDPNFQNFPSKDNRIRNGFFIDASIDYSGQELRAAALMSKDSRLTRELAEGINPMKGLAAQVFGANYSPTEYVSTKVVTYATLYSGGPSEVSRQSGVPYDLVKSIQDTWYSTYAEFKAWTEYETEKAARLDYVIGYDGRVMVIPRARDKRTGRMRPKPYVAANRKIQGFGATLMKAAIREIWKSTPYGPYLAACVHDELDLVKPDPAVGTLSDMVRSVSAIMHTTVEGIEFPVEAEIFESGRWSGHYV